MFSLLLVIGFDIGEINEFMMVIIKICGNLGILSSTNNLTIKQFPKDKSKTWKVRRLSTGYIKMADKNGAIHAHVKALSKKEESLVLAEVREGICGSHIGGRTLGSKLLRVEYYWSEILRDIAKFINRWN